LRLFRVDLTAILCGDTVLAPVPLPPRSSSSSSASPPWTRALRSRLVG